MENISYFANAVGFGMIAALIAFIIMCYGAVGANNKRKLKGLPPMDDDSETKAILAVSFFSFVMVFLLCL